MTIMKTIIAGSRTLNSLTLVREAMAIAEESEGIIPTLVVSGTAKGIDTKGEEWARENSLPLVRFPAEWKRYKKSAGYIRNIEMAEYADALVAIWDGFSPGTKHMIDTAQYKGLKVFVFFVNKPKPMWERKPTLEEMKINDWPH